MLVRMSVMRLAVDPFTGMPVVVLKDERGRALPIWIGLCEASAISTQLEGVELTRPGTHDLMAALLARAGARIVRVEIAELREGAYHASVCLQQPGREVAVDARPSDAIALALRTAAPICVEEALIDRARREDFRLAAEDAEDASAWSEPLARSLDEPVPSAKWKM